MGFPIWFFKYFTLKTFELGWQTRGKMLHWCDHRSVSSVTSKYNVNTIHLLTEEINLKALQV